MKKAHGCDKRRKRSEISAEHHHVPLQLKWIIEPFEQPAGVKGEQLIPLVLFGPRGPKNVRAQ